MCAPLHSQLLWTRVSGHFHLSAKTRDRRRLGCHYLVPTRRLAQQVVEFGLQSRQSGTRARRCARLRGLAMRECVPEVCWLGGGFWGDFDVGVRRWRRGGVLELVVPQFS
jgi:hypothetical protein